jgi:hypothetical protein
MGYGYPGYGMNPQSAIHPTSRWASTPLRRVVPAESRQEIGNKLYANVARLLPLLVEAGSINYGEWVLTSAGKIVGMFLEGCEESELNYLLIDDSSLRSKIMDACEILSKHNTSSTQ